MGVYMLETGRIIRCQGKENIFGQMENTIAAVIRTTRSMVLVLLPVQMEENTRERGRKVNKSNQVHSRILKG